MTPIKLIDEEARGAALRTRRAAQAARRRRAARGDAHASGEAARRAALKVAAAALAARDGTTSAHSQDVVLLCRAIADRFGIRGREREDLLAAAKLHDLGKIAVPMEILEKTGPLNNREWETIRQHTLVGQQILDSVQELQGVAAIVRSCHERWDGAGYPDGLAGEEIPLAARVVFCADAFHAIREDRPYRKGRSAARALEEVRRNAGTQFDPLVVRALEDAARALRQAGPNGLHTLSAPLRSRRLLALLATLMIGGSALAATGVRLPTPFAGSDEPDAGEGLSLRECGLSCVVDLGRLGRVFPSAGGAQAGVGAAYGAGGLFDLRPGFGPIHGRHSPWARDRVRPGGGAPGPAPTGEGGPEIGAPGGLEPAGEVGAAGGNGVARRSGQAAGHSAATSAPAARRIRDPARISRPGSRCARRAARPRARPARRGRGAARASLTGGR